jgi:hypothetical protein
LSAKLVPTFAARGVLFKYNLNDQVKEDEMRYVARMWEKGTHVIGGKGRAHETTRKTKT